MARPKKNDSSPVSPAPKEATGLSGTVEINGFKGEITGNNEEDQKRIEEAFEYSMKIKKQIQEKEKEIMSRGKTVTQDGVKILPLTDPQAVLFREQQEKEEREQKRLRKKLINEGYTP